MKKQMIKITQLCMTTQTLYAVDADGYVWFVDLKTGEWCLHGNPTVEDRALLLRGPANA